MVEQTDAELLEFWRRRNREDDARLQGLAQDNPGQPLEVLFEALDNGYFSEEDPGALEWAQKAYCEVCQAFDCVCK